MDMIEATARVAHEANRAWCAANGDMSQPEWEAAPEWQKNSAMDGVRFHMENPNAGDSASHDNWMRHKEGGGWVYGEVKDDEAKTHPCMVPFDQLPRDQQIKDALFRAIVHATI
ncbi:MAG: RyR domain-containing protein [Pseudomonadota bacterium]